MPQIAKNPVHGLTAIGSTSGADSSKFFLLSPILCATSASGSQTDLGGSIAHTAVAGSSSFPWGSMAAATEP